MTGAAASMRTLSSREATFPQSSVALTVMTAPQPEVIADVTLSRGGLEQASVATAPERAAARAAATDSEHGAIAERSRSGAVVSATVKVRRHVAESPHESLTMKVAVSLVVVVASAWIARALAQSQVQAGTIRPERSHSG